MVGPATLGIEHPLQGLEGPAPESKGKTVVEASRESVHLRHRPPLPQLLKHLSGQGPLRVDDLMSAGQLICQDIPLAGNMAAKAGQVEVSCQREELRGQAEQS